MAKEGAKEDEAPDAAARGLIRAKDAATLATALSANAGADVSADAGADVSADAGGNLDEEGGGSWPYASLVMVACTFDASPILLISNLAEHTKNILRDDRVSLLYDGTIGVPDRLTGARVSVLGRAERTEDPHARNRYLARHPSAAGYAGFADFGFYRVAVTRAHLVAGFGRIDWIDGPDLTFEHGAKAPLAMAEADLITETNEISPEILRVLVERLGLDGDGWRMTGCDPEGCDLRREGDVARFTFPSPVFTPDEARAAFAHVRGQE